ncbi:hypothetical protein [Algihabitans albus]|uniref:hypothetical protein n=1 Tax=Algihabitans albus TaxID=2164067 RepID=UPI0013C3395B|nr:hypothetical protein [Algihabitans albus]
MAIAVLTLAVGTSITLNVMDAVELTPRERAEAARQHLTDACASIVIEFIRTPSSFVLDRGSVSFRDAEVTVFYERQNYFGAIVRYNSSCTFEPAEAGPLQLTRLRVETREVEPILVDAWNGTNRIRGDWTWPETP